MNNKIIIDQNYPGLKLCHFMRPRRLDLEAYYYKGDLELIGKVEIKVNLFVRGNLTIKGRELRLGDIIECDGEMQMKKKGSRINFYTRVGNPVHGGLHVQGDFIMRGNIIVYKYLEVVEFG